MTALLERVPVDRISAQAREIHLGRLLLLFVAGFFFLLGWLARKLALAFVWCGVAVKVGWQEAARKAQPDEPAR